MVTLSTIYTTISAMKITHQQREVAAAVEVGSVRWGHLYTGNVKNLLAVRKYAGGVISGLHIF